MKVNESFSCNTNHHNSLSEAMMVLTRTMGENGKMNRERCLNHSDHTLIHGSL